MYNLKKLIFIKLLKMRHRIIEMFLIILPIIKNIFIILWRISDNLINVNFLQKIE